MFSQGGKHFLAFLLPDGDKRSELKGRLTSTLRTDGGVKIAPTSEGAQVFLDGALWTEYRAKDGPKPYFWPLIGPTGKAVTRAHPMAKVDGEDYDLNALVDYVVDKRADGQPAENIYTKKLRRQRDVAVSILLDQSSSTARTITRKIGARFSTSTT